MFSRWRSVTSATAPSASAISGRGGCSRSTNSSANVQTPSSDPSDDSRVVANTTT